MRVNSPENDILTEIKNHAKASSKSIVKVGLNSYSKSEIDLFHRNKRNQKITGLKETDYTRWISPKDMNLKHVQTLFARIKVKHEKFIEENTEYNNFTRKVLEKIMGDRKWLKEKLLFLINDAKLESFLRERIARANLRERVKDSQMECEIVKGYVKATWASYLGCEKLVDEMLSVKGFPMLEGNAKKWEYEIIKRVFFDFLNDEVGKLEQG